jgi:site-specific recombinase XerD
MFLKACSNSAFHRQSPDKLGIEHVREYRLHLLARGLKATSINPIVGALRFFYGVTLGNKEMAEQMPYARAEDSLPAVLTPDEVVRLLRATPNMKIRTALITIYAAGLRVSEVVSLDAAECRTTVGFNPYPGRLPDRATVRNCSGVIMATSP